MFFLYYFDRILILAAIVPAIFLLVKIYQADRSEKEPPQLLGSLILRGVFATMIAIVLERLGDRLLPRWMDPYSLEYQLVENFLIVGLAEEGSKYFLMKGRTWNSPAFNYSFDAVVYGAFVSLGFALWENISYVMMYGLDVAVLRAVTAIPGHACFGVFMGAWYGAAKRQDGFGVLPGDGASVPGAAARTVRLHGHAGRQRLSMGVLWIHRRAVRLGVPDRAAAVAKRHAHPQQRVPHVRTILKQTREADRRSRVFVCEFYSVSSAATMSPIMYSEPQAQTTPSFPACSMAVRTPSATVAQGVAFAPR